MGVNQYCIQLNKYMNLLFMFIIVFGILIYVISFAPHYIDGFDDETYGKIIRYSVQFLYIPVLVVFISGLYFIVERNQRIDRSIKDVCAQYNTEFQRIGYSLEYKTMHTGFCKTKHARPVRVIIFKPTSVL